MGKLMRTLDFQIDIVTVFRAMVVISITVLVVRIVRGIAKRSSITDSIYKKFAFNVIVAIVYIAGFIMAIGQIPQLHQVMQTMLAGSGILALAISLSAQESLGNIVNGLFIALFKPFEIGDRVKLVNQGITGTIENITLRHTVIKTFINSRIVVPNSIINKEVIENSSLFDRKASQFIDVIIGYEDDIHRAMEIIAEVIGGTEKFTDIRTPEEIEEGIPKVKVFVRELGTNGVALRASMWTDTVSENFEACSEARLEIIDRFKAENIKIRYNTVHIINNKESLDG